jgi:hypothetical protein
MRGMILLLLALAPATYAENTMFDVTSTSKSTETVPVEQPATPQWSQWPVVGSAQLEVFLFDIYRSFLHAPGGQYQSLNGVADHPMALSILYDRSIEQQDLVKETVKQWQHLGYNQQQIEQWQQTIAQLFPTVNEGDRLTYITDGQQGWLLFQANNASTQTLSANLDKGFNEAFLSIWLSENTKYPQHRKQLIGEK